VGEAGCLPTGHSLIADHFGRTERPRAIGRYMLGSPLGMVMGYILAGWLNELYGWRITFIVLGLPGLALAILVRMSLKEPREKPDWSSSGRLVTEPYSSSEAEPAKTQPSLRTVCILLWSNKTFRHLMLYFSVVSIFGYGFTQWKPAFFIRSYGLKTGELGVWFALSYGIAGIAGTYLGGRWASRYAAHNERLQLKAMAVATCGFGLISVFIYLSPSYHLALALMALGTVGNTATLGPLFATMQTLIPQRMRATAIAVNYLFANLIGLGIGPLVVGALSDALQPRLGQESLRYALLLLCPGYLWAAWHLWCSARSVTDDLKRVCGACDSRGLDSGKQVITWTKQALPHER
jgi:MFS transporter, Spinster family, sphingosine-1-phosphate transporter